MASGDPKLGQLDSWRKDEITVSSPDTDVPTLYHTDMSYYSQVTRLVLEEEGVLYRSRGVDIHSDQEQMEEWYMKINPNAVVPTLMYRGKPVIESKDISFFVVDKISAEGKLLPKDQQERQNVVELVELHFKDCEVEKVTMGQMCYTNKLMALVMPKKVNIGIGKLEKMKKENPELSDVVDKRIQHLHERLQMFANPKQYRDDALVPLKKVLDSIEKNMKDGDFVCGSNYTMADCMFTCLLARLSMVHLLPEILTTRPKLSAWWNKVQMRSSFKAAGIVKDPITFGTIAKKACNIL